jgi:pimeloyl-ACP methyl ester carboxylesterase
MRNTWLSHHLFVALSGVALAASAADALCRNVSVPVALAEGQVANQQISARLCEPGGNGASARTLLVLVHGITYDRNYWDIPDPTGHTDRYSFVSAASKKKFSTLSVDRIGAGQSSHPLSALVTIDSNAHTVHQLIQAVRNGSIRRTGGGVFDTVVLVGHSYGSWTTWFEATRYDDVDAVVLTGATHGLTTVNAPFIVVPGLYPAAADPRFGLFSGLDPGYLTTQPGTRYHAFYEPADVDPAVVAYDEMTKGTVTASELQTYPLILDTPLDIRVPVFLTVGELDTLFCGPALGGAPCTSEEELIAFEGPHLGANVPSVDAYILPAAGHDMNPMLNARLYFAAVIGWLETTVLP